MYLFAQAPVVDPLGAWGQLTALGIVAVVLVFIIVRMLPAIHVQFVQQATVFADAMIAVQKEFSEAMIRLGTVQHEDSVSITKAVTELREHCAAARALLKGIKHDG